MATLAKPRHKKDYWSIVKEDILQNRQLVFFALLTGILCFGFTVTNFSIGIDDPARNHYLYTQGRGNMIQQGRLLHILWNQLTRTVQFIPFFSDFVGAALYILSALLYCGLFQYLTDGRISLSSLICFSCVYISSSILAEKFIYQLDVVVIMISYCCSPLSLMYAHRFLNEKSLRLFAMSVITLMIAIASYESFICLYFCGVFGIFLLEMAIGHEAFSFRRLLSEGLQYAVILCVSMVLYYGLVALLQIITGQYGVFQRAAYSWPEGLGLWGIFLFLSNRIFQFFLLSFQAKYLPILVFCLLSVVGFGLFLFLSMKKRTPWLIVCYMALWAGNFFIHYAGENFTSRAAQTFCFFSGFIVLMLLEFFNKASSCKKLLCLAIALLVYIQAADMNRWFYNDYVRYQKEAFAIHTIAQELSSKHDTSKPVVFTNSPPWGSLDTALYEGRQSNGNSLIYWTGYAFRDRNQLHVSEVFRMHGYDFIQSPTEEQYWQAQEEGDHMPPWPQEGCIQEFQEFIVVNFG